MKPGTHLMSRREVIGAGIAGIGATVLSACWKSLPGDAPGLPLDPYVTVALTAPTGTATIGLSVPISSQTEEAFLYVPAGYQPATPVPLVLMFHGEAETSYQAINTFVPHADAAGLALLSIDSASTTWDVFQTGNYGPDVQFMNAALAATFREVNVDPTRIAVQGFSNGATYAIAVGRTNGDFFSHVIANSASALIGATPTGRPKIFLSHGISDATYDITETGDFVDAQLVGDGYDVDYIRFAGVHELPDAIVQQSITWLAS